MKGDLERERDDILRLIHEEADESIRRMLELVPGQPQSQHEVTVLTSTEGTSDACPE